MSIESNAFAISNVTRRSSISKISFNSKMPGLSLLTSYIIFFDISCLV